MKDTRKREASRQMSGPALTALVSLVLLDKHVDEVPVLDALDGDARWPRELRKAVRSRRC